MFFKDCLINIIILVQQGFVNFMFEFILRCYVFFFIVDVLLDWLVESNLLFNRIFDIDVLIFEDFMMEIDGFDFFF